MPVELPGPVADITPGNGHRDAYVTVSKVDSRGFARPEARRRILSFSLTF